MNNAQADVILCPDRDGTTLKRKTPLHSAAFFMLAGMAAITLTACIPTKVRDGGSSHVEFRLPVSDNTSSPRL